MDEGELNADAPFARAQSAQADGHHQIAEAHYRQAITIDPSHAASLLELGHLLAHRGDLSGAIELLSRAAATIPDWAECLYHVGLLQLQAGKLLDAEKTLTRVVELEPGFPDAHNVLGVVCRRLADTPRAISAYRTAISLRSDFPEALNNLGSALIDTGSIDEAADAFERAIRANPNYVEAISNLANIKRQLGQLEAAISLLQRAIALRPQAAELHYNLGIALQSADRLHDAIATFKTAVSLRLAYPDAHNNLGTALHAVGDFPAAIAEYRTAIAIKPNVAEFHNNLGRALKEIGDVDGAIAAYQQAIALDQGFADARTNLGTALIQAGNVDAAISEFAQADSDKAGDFDTQWNYALALLLRGDFQRGWLMYEARHKRESTLLAPALAAKLWDGSPLNGRRILLAGEQGLGDTIQMIRYADIVEAAGGSVAIVCQPSLHRLFADQFAAERVTSFDDPLPAFDVSCPVMSLPHRFNTSEQTIPNVVPYLTPANHRIEQWRARFALLPTGLRVGLVWAGNPFFGNDRNRSIPLAALASLSSVSNITWVSLQKDAKGAASLLESSTVHDFMSDAADFADTASIIANLDLVISVDTAVAHLAGAMGKSVWLMLPFAPDWRWQLNRTDSPWYPTLRLFRQTTRGDWSRVIDDIAAQLRSINSSAS